MNFCDTDLNGFLCQPINTFKNLKSYKHHHMYASNSQLVVSKLSISLIGTIQTNNAIIVKININQINHMFYTNYNLQQHILVYAIRQGLALYFKSAISSESPQLLKCN